jgi:RNA polymerase sigma factor (sigma-70 family)
VSDTAETLVKPADHIGMAYTISNRFERYARPRGFSRDDLVGEAFLAVVQAAPTYNPARCEVATFVWCAMKWRLLRLLRRQPIHLVPLATNDEGKVLDEPAAPDEPDGGEDREHVAQLLRCLRRQERLVVELYFGIGHGDALTCEAVGERLGTSRARVQQILSGALKKLRAAAQHEEEQEGATRKVRTA